MSIKEIVFEYIHINNGFINYEELINCVFGYNPQSAWKKSHWDYYRSQITSPNGRYPLRQICRSQLLRHNNHVPQLPLPKMLFLFHTVI